MPLSLLSLTGPSVAQPQMYTCDGPFPAPPPPNSYSVTPGVTVYEGAVAPDPANAAYVNVKAALRGYEASVAIAGDGTSASNFIVAWASEPLFVNNMPRDTCFGPLASNYIFLNRFSAADGHCLTWTQGGNSYGPTRASEVSAIGIDDGPSAPFIVAWKSNESVRQTPGFGLVRTVPYSQRARGHTASASAIVGSMAIGGPEMRFLSSQCPGTRLAPCCLESC